MTDKEYMEAFNHCMKVEGCFGCNLYGEGDCHEKLADGINSIINSRQTEIERLQEKNIEDNRLLNDRVIESVNVVSKAHLKYEKALEERLKTAKAEARKEFAERLKEKGAYNSYNELIIFEDMIDDLVKEMEGAE